jgi:PPOX class probable F420-dependent enzyme
MRAMTRAEVLEFLAVGTRTGKLATASASGDPHVAPVWFVLDGETVVFTTYHDTIKARNLTARPSAALTVDFAEFPYHFAMVRGPVTLDRAAPDLEKWSRRLAARYVPPERTDEFARRNAVPGEWLCRLTVQRTVGRWDMAN